MKLIQVNLNRCRAAHDLLDQVIVEEEADVVVVSEPNVTIAERRGWYVDTNSDAAVAISKKTPKTRVVNVEKCNGIVWIELEEVCIGSAYVSPNAPLQSYVDYLNQLEVFILRSVKPVILCGDLNSKSTSWGSPTTDCRGEKLEELLCTCGMIVGNVGGVPTFSRGTQEAHLDLTLYKEELGGRVIGWKVLERESLSDHKYITFKVTTNPGHEIPNRKSTNWVLTPRSIEQFAWNYQAALWNGNIVSMETPEELEDLVIGVCNNTFQNGKHTDKRGIAKYWWTPEIAEARRTCNITQRRLSRKNRKFYQRPNEELGIQRDELRARLRESRMKLKKLIEQTKKHKWKELLDELEQDVWGRAYKIVTGKMGIRARHDLSPEEEYKIAEELFPTGPRYRWRGHQHDPALVPNLSDEEWEGAIKRLKDKSAPGPDRITNEILKIIIREAPEVVKGVMEKCLKEGSFPAIWKTARLVLVPKPEKQGVRREYRPLCMLNTMGKLLERLITNRLEKEIESKGGISENQYGFRKGRSTIDAVTRILNIAESTNRASYGKRRYSVMVSLDIKNAFNTAPWTKIVAAVERLGVSEYLQNTVKSYLENRTLIAGGDGRVLSIRRGVPQGSVLGPLLWNVFYDGVLHVHLPDGAHLTAYADDLALVVVNGKVDALNRNIHMAMENIEQWILENGLDLAGQKTEAVVLSGRRTLKEVTLRVKGVEITSKPAIKYLGVWLDKDVTMKEHVRQTVAKADKTVTALARLMPTDGGPSRDRRRILASVAHSITLYAASTWAKAMQYHKYRAMLLKTQRKVALRVVAAYRTVSTEALQVVAGIPPLDLAAAERTEIYLRGLEQAKDARERMLEKWQSRWNEASVGRWTWELIPNIKTWLDKGATGTDHYVAQFLTGHGCFRKYLQRIGKVEDPTCVYCGGGDDTAEHVLECGRWARRQQHISAKLGERLTKQNFLKHVGDGRWDAMRKFIGEIMRTRVREELAARDGVGERRT